MINYSINISNDHYEMKERFEDGELFDPYANLALIEKIRKIKEKFIETHGKDASIDSIKVKVSTFEI